MRRYLSGEDGRKLEWDKAIPTETCEKFVSVLQNMKAIKNIRFHRFAVPRGVNESVKPDLITIVDGLTSPFCALANGC